MFSAYNYYFRSTNNGTFTEFYKKFKQAIHSINENNEEFKISYLEESKGIRRIRTVTKASPIDEEAIYFNHIRRTPMSSKQFEKTANLLGLDVAKYLKHSNLTTVFTSDITKQKSFILTPNYKDNV